MPSNAGAVYVCEMAKWSVQLGLRAAHDIKRGEQQSSRYLQAVPQVSVLQKSNISFVYNSVTQFTVWLSSHSSPNPIISFLKSHITPSIPVVIEATMH
jgi:hypothetical protein